MCLVAFVGIGLLLSVVSTHAKVSNVAFTAGFHADQTIDGGKIVAFKDVFTNLGNDYNSSTGVFTALWNGLYVFSINAQTLSSEEFFIDLYHNDYYLISAFARTVADYAYGGNSVVLKLVENDKVYVKTRRTAHFYGRQDEVYATFTGYRIVDNVAFTAGFWEDQTIGADQIVAYKRVFINSGNGYNSNTGIFTARKRGIYGFNIRGLTTSGREFWLELYKNNEYMISAFARHGHDYTYGGNSVVLQLQKNDRGYVKARRRAYLYGRLNQIYATFTGFLIGKFSCKDGNVAFTAGFKDVQTIGGNQTIAYKEVFTNVAGGYNSSTGVFTAPKGGVYVFNIRALASKKSEFWIELYQNNKYLISAFARLTYVDEYSAGGNTITLQLKLGDKVYVKTRRTAYLYNLADEVYATFSGYLIGTSC